MPLTRLLSLGLLAALAACGRADDRNEEQSAANVAVGSPEEPSASVSHKAAPADVPFDRLAGVKVGMTLAQMRASGMTVRRDPGPDPEAACSYARISRLSDIDVMLNGPAVVRIDVRSPAYPTLGGVRVGLSEAEALRRLGGRAVVKPHPYTGPEGHYLVVHKVGAQTGLILETDGQTVESYRIGLWGPVQWIEGCQ